MRRKLWFSGLAVAAVAILIAGVPALVIAAGRSAAAAAIVAASVILAAALAA